MRLGQVIVDQNAATRSAGMLAHRNRRSHGVAFGVDDRDVVAAVIGDVGVRAAGWVGNAGNRLRMLGAVNNPRAAKQHDPNKTLENAHG